MAALPVLPTDRSASDPADTAEEHASDHSVLATLANLISDPATLARLVDGKIPLANLPVPLSADLPLGGASKSFLRKKTTADFDVEWATLGSVFGIFSVKDHGAVGDGVTDDTAAIQAAINAASAGDKRQTVWFPGGSYKVTSSLFLSSKPVMLKGQSERGTFIYGAGTAHVIVGINATVVTGIVMQDINIQANPTPQSTYDCVYLEKVELASFDRVGFGNARYGMNFALACRDNTISNCVFGSNNVMGLVLGNTSDYNGLVNNWIDENTSIGIDCNSSFNTFVGNRFLDNSGSQLRLNVSAVGNVVVGNGFISGTAEPYSTNQALDIYGNRNLVVGNYIDDHDFADINVRSGATGNVVWPNLMDGASVTDAGTGTVKKAAAVPDTSGATLTQLEAEVNKLKAALRTAGVMS